MAEIGELPVKGDSRDSSKPMDRAQLNRVPVIAPKAGSIHDAWGSCEAAIKRFIGKFLYRPEDIEDLAQETFLRAFNAVKFRELTHPRAYLFQVAKSIALKELSRKSRQLTDYIEEAVDTEFSDSVELEQEIAAERKVLKYCNAIASLPPQCRKVFLMRKVQGLSHKEISNALGISQSGVEKHVALGIKRVDSWLEENNE